ncbi:MAG: hypothetical protein Q4C14_02275 [Bacillota bacterium]|nr:hypothetical protein [Bacillota bacterium]
MAKNKLKKLFAVMLAGTLTISAATATAFAVEYDLSSGSVHVEHDSDKNESYSYQKTESGSSDHSYDKEITVKGNGTETGNTVNVGDNVSGVTVTLDNVKIKTDDGSSAVTVGNGSNIKIELDGNNELGGSGAGINVKGEVSETDSEGNKTVIREAASAVIGDENNDGGSLKAVGGNGSAGIGGASGEKSGNIIINGGIIEAQGGQNAAGIGGGYKGSNGSLIINSGLITAIGGQNAAGIGGGSSAGDSNGSYKLTDRSGGSITIHGGTVNATGGSGNGGAGIGGGSHGDGGVITIDGGDITAVGGNGGAGIGAGTGSSKTDSSGKKGPGYYHGGQITISGGKINATGGWNSAGIGGGYCGDSGEILITGGEIIATGMSGNGGNATNHGGAGIGGGYEGHANITITGGTVTASAGVTGKDGERNSAAGIGSGATPNSNTARGTSGRGAEAAHSFTSVNISGGSITAYGGEAGGAGIGGGAAADKVVITIDGGIVKAYGGKSTFEDTLGGAGIGGGMNSLKSKYTAETDLTIVIKAGDITAAGGWGASGIGSGADNIIANSISLSDTAKIKAFADGIKFAIDSYNRNLGTSNDIAGGNVLQGTLMAANGTSNSSGETGNGAYGGMYLVIYKDADASASMDNLKAYETPAADGIQLPEGYRSFAVSLEKDGSYLIHGSKDDFNTWLGFSPDASETAPGESVPSAHFSTSNNGIVSSSFWIYEIGSNAVLVTEPNPAPAPTRRPSNSVEKDEPVVEIPEEEVPKAELPEENPAVPEAPVKDIADEDVPMAEHPAAAPPQPQKYSSKSAASDGGSGLVEIEEEEVPLSDVPATGDMSGLWAAAAFLSALCLAGTAAAARRKREE